MVRWNQLLVLLMLGSMSAPALAEPWSVKLGFPAGRRVVILEGRELGITWEMNAAVERLLAAGQLTSASVVATGPWFYDIAAWARQHPQHDVGLSVALTNPYSAMRWRLLTSEQGPTTLVNADGFPWQNVVQFVVSADAEDVRRELDAQVMAARAAGLVPSHISGYYGTALSRQDLTAVFLAASQKYWIPAPVVELTPELVERFRREGYPIDDATVQLIANYPLPKLDDLQPFPQGSSYEQTRDNFCELLTLLQPGLTQIMCRPALESEGLKRLTPDWQQRSWTEQTLSDPKVREMLETHQVILTNWREVMQRFEGGTPFAVEQHRDAEADSDASDASE
jgi:chitin disaccharide deacetylase